MVQYEESLTVTIILIAQCSSAVISILCNFQVVFMLIQSVMKWLFWGVFLLCEIYLFVPYIESQAKMIKIWRTGLTKSKKDLIFKNKHWMRTTIIVFGWVSTEQKYTIRTRIKKNFQSKITLISNVAMCNVSCHTESRIDLCNVRRCSRHCQSKQMTSNSSKLKFVVLRTSWKQLKRTNVF